MAEPLSHATPGQPFRPSAKLHNRTVDVIRWVDEQRVIFGQPPIGDGGSGFDIRVAFVVQDVTGMTGGNPDWFSTDYAGLATVLCNSEPDGSGTAYTVYLRSQIGVWLTGSRVIIANPKDDYYADARGWEIISPGESDWKGTADGAISSVDAGDIVLPFYDYRSPGAGTITIPNADVELLDTNFPVANGNAILVRFNQTSAKFQIYWTGCG